MSTRRGGFNFKRLVVLLIVAAVIAALPFAGRWVWDSPFMKLKRVEVLGNTRTPAATLVEASGLRAGRHLLKLSTSGVSKRIQSSPWIAHARVERILPSKVRITVTERVARLQIAISGKTYLVDAEGVVLEEGTAPLPQLFDLPIPAVAPGDRVSMPQYSHVIRILDDLGDRLRPAVARIRAPSVDRITLELADGPTIVYGAAEKMNDKNYAVQALLDRAASQGTSIERIDVRVPSRPAVKFR